MLLHNKIIQESYGALSEIRALYHQGEYLPTINSLQMHFSRIYENGDGYTLKNEENEKSQ
jgi:hypothetical protein